MSFPHFDDFVDLSTCASSDLLAVIEEGKRSRGPRLTADSCSSRVAVPGESIDREHC